VLNPFQRIAVLGEGVTGTAIKACSRALNITVTDYQNADLLIVSPGIPPSQFPAVSCPIISELDFAFLLLKHNSPETKIIAITGTNGKTTVTSLIAHLLNCPAVGNIGVPMVSVTHSDNGVTAPAPVIGVEVSSYQLETTQYFTADLAILLNISEDHLHRHHTLDAYAAAKQRLIQPMSATSTVIYNHLDPRIVAMLPHTAAQCIPINHHTISSAHLPKHLQNGPHCFNAQVAAMAAKWHGMTDSDIRSKLSAFAPLPHRQELVGTFQSRIVINDSKATNPHAVQSAIQMFAMPIHLILCGEDKGVDMTAFLNQIHPDIASITVFGDLVNTIIPKAVPKPIQMATDLHHAVSMAFQASAPGDVILFSPGSSSYDQFHGYEDRGNQFKQHVIAKYTH
jgi:UDP-N-acetylmuramoylalanine--D-glutamate ligase